MANTEADLVKLVMENVANWNPSQTISAEDYQTIAHRIPFAISLLSAKNVSIEGDTADLTAIPDAIMLPLAACVSYHCARAFSVDPAKMSELASDYEQAIRDLTTYYKDGFPRRTLRVPHFGRSCAVRGGGSFTNGT